MDTHLLNVALGIAGVFALFSLLVSAIQEIVAGLLKTRARQLARGIADLLGSTAAREALYTHPLVRSVAPPPNVAAGLFSGQAPGPTRASYISARTFVTTLLDLYLDPHGTLGTLESQARTVLAQVQVGNTAGLAALADTLARAAATVPHTPLAATLTGLATLLAQPATPATAHSLQAFVDAWPEALRTQLLARASGVSTQLSEAVRALTTQGVSSIAQLRSALEGWYDEAMDRVTGLYKRWTMAVQFAIGLTLAFGMNVDAIAIVSTLRADPARAERVAEHVTDLSHSRSASRTLQATPGDGIASWRITPTSWNELLVERGSGITAPPALRARGGQLAPAFHCEARQHAGPGLPFACAFDDPHVKAGPAVVYDVCETEAPTCTSIGTLTITFVDGPETLRAAIVEELDKLDVPIGWPAHTPMSTKLHASARQYIGWLLTACAACLGAPFWFDLLRKAANLRAAGRTPEDTAAPR